MNNQDKNQKPKGFMAHVPFVFVVLVVITLLMAIWVRPPLNYILWCMALGVPWLAFLTVSWRMRSDLLTIVGTLLIVAVLAWLSHGGLLRVLHGYCMSTCSALLLLWIGRQQIQRFISNKKA